MNILASEPPGSGMSISGESAVKWHVSVQHYSDGCSHIPPQRAPLPPGSGKEGSNFDWLYWCQPFTKSQIISF